MATSDYLAMSSAQCIVVDSSIFNKETLIISFVSTNWNILTFFPTAVYLASMASPPPQSLPPGMMWIKCTVKVVTAAGIVYKFPEGVAYILDRYNANPDGVIKLVVGAIIPLSYATSVIVHTLLSGCFQILVEIRSLDALDEFWNSYIKGEMKEKLEKVIVTDELRSLAPDDAVNVELSLMISEEEYQKTRDYLLETGLRNDVRAAYLASMATSTLLSSPSPPPLEATTATVSSSSSSSSNKEKANHTRLCRLLVDIGRQVLQDVFDRIHPPSTLNAVLWSASNQKILKNLKTKKVLFGKQWDTLFPTSGAVTSADFDITLLFLLLRNICKLKAPGTGWDNPPLVCDLSKEADLVRIKRCRNELYAHIVNAAIPDNEFQTLWDDIEAALLRLGGSKYHVQIHHLNHGNLDADCEDSFKVLLKSWEEGEEKTLNTIRILDDYPLPLVPSVGLPLASSPPPPFPDPLPLPGIAAQLRATLTGESIQNEKTDKGMISMNGAVKILTAGGLAVAWAAGSYYLLRRHVDDPEKIKELVAGAIIPSFVATGALMHMIQDW